MPSPYLLYNFCITCKIKYPKSITRCSECGKKIRTKPNVAWKEKTRMKFRCSSCGHIYGECACLCCRADEANPENS